MMWKILTRGFHGSFVYNRSNGSSKSYADYGAYSSQKCLKVGFIERIHAHVNERRSIIIVHSNDPKLLGGVCS